MVLKKSEIQFLRHETEQNQQTLHLPGSSPIVNPQGSQGVGDFHWSPADEKRDKERWRSVEHRWSSEGCAMPRLLVPFLQLLQLLLHVVVVGTQKGQLLGDPPGKIRKEKKGNK